MKKILLLTAVLLLVKITNAQFSPEKYFTDSISFRYDECWPLEKKDEKKGVKPCLPMIYTARASFSDFSVTATRQNSAKYPGSEDFHVYYEGKIKSIDFSQTKIFQQKEMAATTTTNPPEIYQLRIRQKNHEPAFTSKDDYFPQKNEYTIFMYFASYEDAKAVMDLLEQRATIMGW